MYPEPEELNPFLLAAESFANSNGAEYMYDPVGFAENLIAWPRGQSLTAYQRDIMQAVVDRRRLAVRGPHGLGKTTSSALLILWFALTREAEHIDWKVATTAGNWRQLIRYLWPEVHKWTKLLDWKALGRPPFNPRTELVSQSLKLTYGAAFAVASTDPEKIEGVHADSVLYVFDESKIIKAATFDSAEGAFSGAKPVGLPEAFVLAQSTPGEPSGRFYDIHARKPGFEDWTTRHVKTEEVIAAGRITRDWAEARGRQWGTQSALYYNKVLGEFHESDEGGVIKISWVEAANERWLEWDAAGRPAHHSSRTIGVDVAYGGRDLTVLCQRRGPHVLPLETMNVADTVKVFQKVQSMIGQEKDCTAVVDVIGVGAGVFDQLRGAGCQAVAFSASGKSFKRDRSRTFNFLNRRAEMWWYLREALDPAFSPTLCIPPDDQLMGELVAPHWKVTAANKIQIESKDDIRTRIGKSTDHADALCQSLLASPLYEYEDMSEDDGPLAYAGPVTKDDLDDEEDEDIFRWLGGYLSTRET